jgi:hypothetical protein
MKMLSAWNIWKMLLINLIKDHITKYQEDNKSYDAQAGGVCELIK